MFRGTSPFRAVALTPHLLGVWAADRLQLSQSWKLSIAEGNCFAYA